MLVSGLMAVSPRVVELCTGLGEWDGWVGGFGAALVDSADGCHIPGEVHQEQSITMHLGC